MKPLSLGFAIAIGVHGFAAAPSSQESAAREASTSSGDDGRVSAVANRAVELGTVGPRTMRWERST